MFLLQLLQTLDVLLHKLLQVTRGGSARCFQDHKGRVENISSSNWTCFFIFVPGGAWLGTGAKFRLLNIKYGSFVIGIEQTFSVTEFNAMTMICN